MKNSIFHPEGVCPKCAFPLSQMYRQFFKGKHDVIEDKEVIKCKVQGEHLHFECCCGNELVLRPLDWKPKKKTKSRRKK